MGILVNEYDIAHLQSLYPLLEMKRLSTQEERLIYLHMKGATVKAAAREVGMRLNAAHDLLHREDVKLLMHEIQQQFREEMRVTRETLTRMLFEAHAKAATASDEIAAIRELGKLHNLYESDLAAQRAKTAPKEIRKTVEVRHGKIERASDEELMALLAEEGEFIDLDPSSYETVAEGGPTEDGGAAGKGGDPESTPCPRQLTFLGDE